MLGAGSFPLFPNSSITSSLRCMPGPLTDHYRFSKDVDKRCRQHRTLSGLVFHCTANAISSNRSLPLQRLVEIHPRTNLLPAVGCTDKMSRMIAVLMFQEQVVVVSDHICPEPHSRRRSDSLRIDLFHSCGLCHAGVCSDSKRNCSRLGLLCRCSVCNVWIH